MAIAGGGIPCNTARLKDGVIVFITMTQNRPADLVVELEEATRRLLAGELVTVDVRPPYMNPLRELVEKKSPADRLPVGVGGAELTTDAQHRRCQVRGTNS